MSVYWRSPSPFLMFANFYNINVKEKKRNTQFSHLMKIFSHSRNLCNHTQVCEYNLVYNYDFMTQHGTTRKLWLKKIKIKSKTALPSAILLMLSIFPCRSMTSILNVTMVQAHSQKIFPLCMIDQQLNCHHVEIKMRSFYREQVLCCLQIHEIVKQ